MRTLLAVNDVTPVPPCDTENEPETAEAAIAIAVLVTAVTLPYASVVITGT